MTIKETDLLSNPCPLMDYKEPVLFNIAHNTLKRCILRSFEGNPLPINKVRNHFVQLWDDHWKELYGEIAENPPTHYWTGPRLAITIAKKIIDFTNKYEIIIPIQPYSAVLDNYIIEGSNCIVRSRVGKDRPWLSLVVIPEVVNKQDHVDLAYLPKWYNTHITNLQSSPSGIILFPIITGNKQTIIIKNPLLAKTWLTQAIKQYQYNCQNQPKALFPIVGAYCKDCESKKCTEALNVGQNEDSRVRWLRQISLTR